MNVLVACEFTGVVRDAFLAKGHNAISCDLLPTESPGPHYQGDVFDIINSGFDLMIAHPPCTRLCNSGVRWLAERSLWKDMEEAAFFFWKLLTAPINKICLENPIPHGYAMKIIQQPYTQIIQPYEHGHPELKQTCLWLKNLPSLVPSKFVLGLTERIKSLPPSEDRGKERSKTYPGIAKAMADQWG